MDHRLPNARAERHKRRREGTGRATARSSTPFTGGASTATIDVTSAPRTAVVRPPEVAASRGSYLFATGAFMPHLCPRAG